VQANHARIAFILSVLLLSLITLDFVKVSADKIDKTPKNKTDLVEAVNKIGEVLSESSGSYFYKFYLKDSSAQNTTGQSESDSSVISGATITIVNKSSFHCGEGGTDFTWSYFGSGLYKITCQEALTMQIKISKSGYNIKTANLAYYQGDIPTIYLTKYVPPPPPPPETIKDVSLPTVFKEGETTDLSKISDPAKVEDLTLDSKNNKIKFNEPVDLSASDTKDKFKVLDQFVDVSEVGILSLDSVNLSALNKKATVVMKNLPFLKTPKVHVDGKEDKTVVSNIKYEKGTLTFDVTHFSIFTAVPTVEIKEPKDGFETNDEKATLRGVVSDPTASVSARLNNKDLGKLKVATASGEFSGEVSLAEGVNKLIVSALSNNGAVAVASVSGSLVAAKISNALVYLLLFVLAMVAAYGIVYSVKKVWLKRSNSQQKLPLEDKQP